MGTKYDAGWLSLLYGILKATGYGASFGGLRGGPPSYKAKESMPLLESPYREIPVHVTKQVARTSDAERPPSNRQRRVQPPGDGGANQPPEDNNANHPFGNGNGGDGDRGGGDRGDGSDIMRGTTAPILQGDRSTWRWSCGNCALGNLSYNYDMYCPDCSHKLDAGCKIWAVA
ncbi:hypothetical protein F5B21DRAFT_442079 [Xylaria acuta]|nr:hypothetical protein F5B21DRAFT_442079 [Xylaria acuta]